MARRRREMLDAAVELFRERGYLGTTVDDIAARAGVTKRTLYHHMGNKENILAEIHSQFIEDGLRKWRNIVAAGGAPTDVLKRLIGEHIAILIENRDAIAVFLEESKHLNPELRADINAQRREYEMILRETIATGVQAGDLALPSSDVPVVTSLVLGGLNEMYRWLGDRAKRESQSLIAQCQELVLHGILAAPEP
jgi:TetR/AcrR family transcriptional regulator, cholesterol catabolism regulator